MIHYNVQSAVQKIDILESELSNFDFIGLSETWFNPNINSSDINISGFRTPFRKDHSDGHGGVAVYVKNDIPCARRLDLEILNIECIWIEVRLQTKRILIGTFYRPPNSDQTVLSNIENSIGLAIDTGISDIIFQGDFNLDLRESATARKVDNICLQYDLHQMINDPTHFTETSSSLTDIMLVSNPANILVSGVGDPFLNLEYTISLSCFWSFQIF